MDSLKGTVNSFTGGVEGNNNNGQQRSSNSGSGGFLGGLGDKLNSAAGGGRESEKNEDLLDKGMKMLVYGLSRTCCSDQQSIKTRR